MSLQERTLALSGVFQATYLVQQTARHGMPQAQAFLVSIRSIFNTTPRSSLEVYGDMQGLQIGLRQTATLLKQRTSIEDHEIMRYAVSLMALERRLHKNPAALAQLGEGIERARAQSEHFSMTHGNVIAHLASLYSDIISHLGPKIMVTGDPAHLSNSDNANRVRALLLSGLRSAVLWRQRGGNHLRLIFGSGAMTREAQKLLAELRIE